MTKSVLGIIGGSGFYSLPGIANARWEKIKSPWGEPSDDILFADLDGLLKRSLPDSDAGWRKFLRWEDLKTQLRAEGPDTKSAEATIPENSRCMPMLVW